MTVRIHHVETLLPEFVYPQDLARRNMEAWSHTERQRRIIRRIYTHSGIEHRHSVLGDFLPAPATPLFPLDASGRPIEPGTAARNDRYAAEAKRLGVELARRALAGAPGFTAADITHVITTTCTGFANPGADFHIVRELGLRLSTRRYALGFMGCYAALPGLHLAEQICRADPAAVVLLACIEFCSLHLRLDEAMDAVLGNAIFADGLSAALVSARPPAAGTRTLRLDGFASELIPAGEMDMAWKIGDRGFEITLSAYVPDLIAANIRPLLEAQAEALGCRLGEVPHWAVHPGGKAILDRVQDRLALQPGQIAASRAVLRRYGNMSSATVLFVLKELLAAGASLIAGEKILALAFGPGLTVETALLTLEA